MNESFWSNKSVLVTGHTGFKGGWLVSLLNMLGARVHGYALAPLVNPNLFDELQLDRLCMSSTISDIRDLDSLKKCVDTTNPEIVFHLAAQPLVIDSYNDPIETYSTNVIGTANVFEAIRHANSVQAVINVTTDKCYQNKEWIWGYRECDELGGYDPYSASKACSELVTSSYRDSFLSKKNVGVASARAGNVIGGGDWSRNRLIPDILQSMNENLCVSIRSPNSTRPWQHVLEPISGYVKLAEKLYFNKIKYGEAWNFGPDESGIASVLDIVEYMHSLQPRLQYEVVSNPTLHEAANLRLDSSKARNYLGWQPRWSLKEAIKKTLEWNECWIKRGDLEGLTRKQIHEYIELEVMEAI